MNTRKTLPMISAITMLALALPLAAATGDRNVNVAFSNQTNDIVTLYVTTAEGTRLVGSVSSGASITATVRVPGDEEEYEVSWRAGKLSGNFVIAPDTPSRLRVVLGVFGSEGP